MFPARRGQPVLQPSCHLSRSFASNLCKPLAIMSHSSTSFHLFFGLPFLSHQLLSVVPLLDPFLHPFSTHAPTITTFALSETLPISLHPSFHESSHCLFYLSKFSQISFATFSFLWSSTSFHLPLSMHNIQHHKLKQPSHSYCITCLYLQRYAFSAYNIRNL